MNDLTDYIKSLSSKQISTSITASCYVIIIIAVGLIVGQDTPEKAITLIIFVLGAVIGWFIAIVISPYTDSEKDRFIRIGQTISAFISGYLLSKLDKPINAYIDAFTSKIGKEEFEIVLIDLHIVRLIGFVISVIVSTIVVYVFRAAEYDALKVTDEVVKLKALLDTGAITQSDFDNKKKKLLGS